ncbi:MAG TPA: hypothetical protein VN699_15655, partial [Pirellulales bacterium]|nr:hypothetical protein [Pirellulales bacterium]
MRSGSRFRLQFSIRDIFWLTLAAAAFLAGSEWRKRQWPEERAQLEARNAWAKDIATKSFGDLLLTRSRMLKLERDL